MGQTSIRLITPSVGDKITPQYFERLNTTIRRFRPIAGKGIRVSETMGGTIIESTATETRIGTTPADSGVFLVEITGGDYVNGYTGKVVLSDGSLQEQDTSQKLFLPDVAYGYSIKSGTRMLCHLLKVPATAGGTV